MISSDNDLRLFRFPNDDGFHNVFMIADINSACLAQQNNQKVCNVLNFKVETILKGSLDSIQSPSPSVKIKIMGRKVGLRCKGKTLLGIVNKL